MADLSKKSKTVSAKDEQSVRSTHRTSSMDKQKTTIQRKGTQKSKIKFDDPDFLPEISSLLDSD